MSKECHAALGYYCDSFGSIIKKIVKEKRNKHKALEESLNRILGSNSCYCVLLMKVCRHPANMVNLGSGCALKSMDRIYCGEKS